MAAAWPEAPQSAAPSEVQCAAEPPAPSRAAEPRAAANPRAAASPRTSEPPARRAEPPAQRAPAPPKPAPRKKAPASAALPRKALTLAYAGRQLRVGPIAFWTVVGTLVVMAGWSVVTASYFAFHDDVVTRMIARQAEVEAAYQDRIAEMRAKVDRVTTRQLLDQEQFEQKLEQVIRRQNMLDGRAGAIRGIDDDGPATTGSVPTRVPRRSSSLEPRAEEPGDGLPKPTPVGDTVVFRAPSDREARLESRRPARMMAAPGRDIRPGLEGKIARLETALDRLEQRQAHRLGSIEESYDGKVRRVRAVLADLGLDHALPPERQIGGPFVPVKLAGPAAFERRLQRVRLARAQADRLTKTLSVIPIRKPITGEVDFSSTFGVRLDPFLGRPAMHTGVDFRGHTGDPVRVTANGTVTSAGWAGGYGRMVEVDHGNGLVTRYGHMSEILVRVGQGVKIGQVVGRVGSTGRSTGPHLHYETRVDGEPVDPQKFLRAGLRIGSL
ncbi:M23 family metallopeptidase [Rhodovulum sp. PH10]|uniref:M23 family metallopeptidase n=1 Tax=Rhodovulum sp. PH10 TaxID=1187851 RepID=UPI00192BF4A0|nr:M23 family metallopeptidase [Rhodovulum sp. PH10]